MQDKNKFLINPKTETLIFGKIPEIKIHHPQHIFEEGLIYLRHGEHIRANRGFGACHIWEAHRKELESMGYTSFEQVPEFVSNIILPGVPIHCEFSNLKGNHRITVLRSQIGIAILEKKLNNNIPMYSVVTAFNRKQAHGTLIGHTVAL